jgi:hypothetical protein
MPSIKSKIERLNYFILLPAAAEWSAAALRLWNCYI